MTRRAVRRLFGVAILLSACMPNGAVRQSNDDFASWGRVVASALDSTNGMPVVVLATARCTYPVRLSENCADSGSLAQLVDGFATQLGIPVEAGDPWGTGCPWAPPEGAKRNGLTAELGVASMSPDSARIMVTTRCASSPALRQVHVFTLSRSSEGHWEVVSRKLRSIS